MLQDIRIAACEMGLVENSDVLADNLDEQCRHALALSTSGKAVGCARIAPDGLIDRVLVLRHEHRAQIEAELKEALYDYANQAWSIKPRVADIRRSTHI